MSVGALSFPDGLPELKHWVPRRNVPVQLYNLGPADVSVPPELRPCLKVTCSEFLDTAAGIRTTKSWTKGAYKIDIHLPKFAMTRSQCSVTTKNLDLLVAAEYDKLVGELADDQGAIVAQTLREAVRQAEKVSNVPKTLANIAS